MIFQRNIFNIVTRAFHCGSIFLLFFAVSSWAQKDIPVYKIGILANRGKEAGLKRWNDTAQVLSKKTSDARFEIVPLTFEEMDAAVRDQKVDFFIANSAYYAKYEILYRAQAIATIRSKVDAVVATTFGGVIFAKADRQDIQSIQDLKNRRVAAVHDRSFGGWITSLREIREAGLNENEDFKELIQCNLQDKVVEAVFRGEADVGIVRTGIIESYVTKHGISQNDFKILNNHRSSQNNFDCSTKLYPEWPFARLAHVDLKLADRVAQVLLSITPHDSAAMNGEYDSWTVPLNYQEVHECLKALHIEPYENYGKVSLKSLFENYKYWILCILILFFLLAFFSLSLVLSNKKLAQSRKEIGKLISRSSSILNFAGEGILGLDMNGCHIFVNRAALDMLGYNEDELLGKPSHSLWHHTRADGSPYLLSECPICLGTMKKGDVVRRSDEIFWKANGTSFPVEYVSNPILEDENVIGVVVIFTDISERLKKESQLQQMVQTSEAAQEELQHALEKLSRQQAEVVATNLQLQEVVRISTIMQKMDEALVKVGSYLLSASNTPKALQNTIECLLMAANVSRVYICENFSDLEKGLCIRQTHEALADGIKSQIQNPFSQHFPYSRGFSRWQKAFSSGDAIWGNVSELPQEESEIFQKQGIESFMAIPIFVGGEWYGFIGFDQHIQTREWKNENFQLLHTAANMIGAYLYKNKIDEQIRLFADAMNSAEELVLITDANLALPGPCIQFVNDRVCQLTGYTREYLLAKTPRIFQGPKTNRNALAKLKRELAAGNNFHAETINYRKDGTEYFVDWHIHPLRGAHGNITHYVSIQRDVTEQKAMEARLSLSSKMEAVGQLASGIAHEINTPAQFIGDNLSFIQNNWTAIQAALEIFNQNPPKETSIDSKKLEFLSKEIPQATKDALEGVQRISSIVKAMREFSHPNDVKTNADLNYAIESTITVARNEWKYVADLETQLDPSLPMVSCFLGDINQVVLNLIVNAAQAIGEKIHGTSQKGLIRISTSHNEKEVTIKIEDNGPGVPESVRERLFEPFFTTKGVGKGTGQGLYISHRIIEQKHGGRIYFESEVGKGTQFFIHLPLTAEINHS